MTIILRLAAKSFRTAPLLLVTLLWACSSYEQPAPGKVLSMNWPIDLTERQPIKLAIPAAFVRYGSDTEYADKVRNAHAQGFVFRNELTLSALWPELAPDVESIRHEWDVPGGGRLQRMLLTSAAIAESEGKHYNLLQSHYSVAVEFSDDMLCIPPMYMPEEHREPHAKCFKRDAPDNKPPQYGLKRVGVDFSKYPEIPPEVMRMLAADDIYTDRSSDGELKTVIICTAEEADIVKQPLPLVPQCEHEFIVPRINAFASISYRRVYLKDWQSIQQRWTDVITSFVSGDASSRP
jgi:hypothetical protein